MSLKNEKSGGGSARAKELSELFGRSAAYLGVAEVQLGVRVCVEGGVGVLLDMCVRVCSFVHDWCLTVFIISFFCVKVQSGFFNGLFSSSKKKAGGAVVR